MTESRLRKIIKTRGHLPSDDAASKLIWLALRNITAEHATGTPGFQAAINLQSQTLTPTGGAAPGFHLAPARKHRLLNGINDISLTLQRADRIRASALTSRSVAPPSPGFSPDT